MSTGELVPGDENHISAAIRKVLGVGPYDKVEVALPQFDRTDGKKITFFLKTVEELLGLKFHAPDWVLIDIGMRVWDEKDGKLHWLFPAEWYDTIPNGYPIVGLDGEVETFIRGETDSDRRFGCLGYGWIRPRKEESPETSRKN